MSRPLIAPADTSPALTPGRRLGGVIDQWSIVSAEQLTRDTLSLIGHLPPSLDLVAAVSRSGLMPGGLIASCLHLPLWSVTARHGLSDPGHGGRLAPKFDDPESVLPPADPRHVLVIDDTCALGREIGNCTAHVRERWPGADVTRCVVYCHPGVVGQVDLYHSLYPGSHYLSWNWPNAGHGQWCAFDFDGILCRDPTIEECSSQDAYERFIREAPPLYLPRRKPIPLIVTARPESVRGLCLDWLARHGCTVEQLMMRDWEAPILNPPEGQSAEFKAACYGMSSCVLFAESSPRQAEQIRDRTNKPVICPAAGHVFPAVSKDAKHGRCCG